MLIATERSIVRLSLFIKMERSGAMQLVALVHPRTHDRTAQRVACATVPASLVVDGQEDHCFAQPCQVRDRDTYARLPKHVPCSSDSRKPPTLHHHCDSAWSLCQLLGHAL
jgi:hypothetical protein